MDFEDDLAFAKFLQDQFNSESNGVIAQKSSNLPTSLVDPSWEYIDPSPDIRQLFLQFNDEYFDGLLGGVEVRWSPRMTLCAGLCCYEGRGGLCSIRLSEPLLKLRPRKDLVETLLHEMIHALLFVTQNNKDHDGHGPEFHKHMNRINKQTGTNISVYHNFHDEVNAYRQHWWKCNGPCQKWSPFHGVVKRAMNRAAAPRDTWWDDHKRKCGGEFTKIKEPENYGKRKAKGKSKDSSTSKKPEKNSRTDSKPNLPTFFDKLKKDQIEKSNKVGNERDGKQRNILSSDSSEENLDHSPKKTKIEHSTETNNIIAFSGKGFVLGGSKTTKIEEKRDKHPLELITTNNKGNSCQITKPLSSGKDRGTYKGDVLSKTGNGNAKHKNGTVHLPSSSSTSKRNDNSNSNQFNIPSTSKPIKSDSSLDSLSGPYNSSQDTKKKRTPSLTIIDAFARCKEHSNDRDFNVEGTSNKPINLCEEAASDVACPACQTSIPLSMINSHLDACLTS